MVSMLSDKYIGSYESPPFSSVMRFLPWQFSLRQVLPDVIQLPPLLSSSLSLLRHIHHHHSSTNKLFFSSQLIPTWTYFPVSPTLLDISPTFVVPLVLSFLMMSSLVIPHIHLNIVIYSTSNIFSALSSLPMCWYRIYVHNDPTAMYTFP